MKRIATCITLGLLTVCAGAGQFSVKEKSGSHVSISHDGRAIMKIMTARDDSTPELTHETYKVYAHVIDPLDEKAERVLTKGAGGKFTHHRGIYIGWNKLVAGDVKGDWWHMKGQERQKFTGIQSEESDEKRLLLKIGVDWVHGEAVIIREVREYRIHAPEKNGAILIEQVSTLNAVHADTSLNGDPEHAGCQFRPNNKVAGNKSAKYRIAGGAVVQKVKDLPWAAMSFKLDDRNYMVQHMCDPSTPKGTRYSAYRDYGRFGAFPTATIAKGESLKLRFGFYVTPGTLPEGDESLDARYKAFAGE